jgi:DNA-binding MarR family transcriptional regulator
MKDDARPDPTRRLARLLVLTAERLKASFAEAAESFDLPVPVARTLMMLTDPEPLSGLAGHLACDPSHLTSIADRLEERGLARRVTGHDRRVKLLEITPAGRELRDRLSAAASAGSPTSQLDDAERATLIELLEQIVADGAEPVRTSAP